MNLKHRNLNFYTPKDVIDKSVIIMIMQTRRYSFGYRTMTPTESKIYHSVHMRREDVLIIMRTLDPEGVGMRKAHRLHWAKGPNNIWHLDGYYKLIQFGFCLHGAIDGFCGKVI